MLSAALVLCSCSVKAIAANHGAEQAAQFKSAAPAQRARLADRMGRGSDAPATITALVTLLESGDAGLRADTAYALRKFRPATLQPASPALIKALTGDPAWRVRANAAYALMTLPESAEASTAFGTCTTDDDERVRAACTLGLATIAKARHAAGPDVVQLLVARLGDTSRLVRYGATVGFRDLGSTDPSTIHALAARLDTEPDPWVRGAIAKALAASGPAAEPALPALTRAVLDPLSLYTAHAVIDAMAAIGAPAVPTLIATLAYRGPASERYTTLAASAAKAALLKLDVPMTDGLIGALQQGPAQQREFAAAVLGGKNREATAAIPFLAAALEDEDIDVRRAAAKALGQLSPYDAGALPPLLDALDDSDPDARRATVDALRSALDNSPSDRLSPALLVQAAKALGDRLGDADMVVAGIAADALGEMGPQAAPALDALKAALLAPHGNNARDAAEALTAMGSIGAPALIEGVRKGASPTDRSRIGIRGRAAAGLATLGWRKQLGRHEDDAVAALIDGLSDPRSDVRSDVAEALGNLGQAGSGAPMKTTAVAALKAAMEREHEDDTRQALQLALRNWGVEP